MGLTKRTYLILFFALHNHNFEHSDVFIFELSESYSISTFHQKITKLDILTLV